jgi:hypothetical protein
MKNDHVPRPRGKTERYAASRPKTDSEYANIDIPKGPEENMSVSRPKKTASRKAVQNFSSRSKITASQIAKDGTNHNGTSSDKKEFWRIIKNIQNTKMEKYFIFLKSSYDQHKSQIL